MAYRTDARRYRAAWDFLSQVIDYQDPILHRRAILAGLLVRNLHTDALIETIDTSSVELTGLAVIAKEVDSDHSITEPTSTDLDAPAYDGERVLGGSTPEQVALSDAIRAVTSASISSCIAASNRRRWASPR